MYSSQKATCFHYQEQPVTAVLGNNRRPVTKTHRAHECTLW